MKHDLTREQLWREMADERLEIKVI